MSFHAASLPRFVLERGSSTTTCSWISPSCLISSGSNVRSPELFSVNSLWAGLWCGAYSNRREKEKNYRKSTDKRRNQDATLGEGGEVREGLSKVVLWVTHVNQTGTFIPFHAAFLPGLERGSSITTCSWISSSCLISSGSNVRSSEPFSGNSLWVGLWCGAYSNRREKEKN